MRPKRTAAPYLKRLSPKASRLESDIREALEGAGCEVPRAFAVEVRTAEAGPRAFEIEYGNQAAETRAEPAAPAPARLVVVRGKAEQEQYALDKPRTNIGRMAELTDAEQRVIRRNHIVFQEGADEANATVSRSHAHVRHRPANTASATTKANTAPECFGRDGVLKPQPATAAESC